MKEEVENAIVKENVGRFKLTYLLLFLEEELYEELEISGEGKLEEDILKDWAILENYLEVKKVIQLLRNGRYKRIKTYITIE